jgi:hypothetical protein
VSAFNLERTFSKLRAAQGDEGHSSDDEEIYQTAKHIYLEREKELLKGLDHDLTEKERMEMTIDHIHDANLKRYDEHRDKDDMRHDLEDADDEELEDRIVEQARAKNRPLYIEEVNRLSRKDSNAIFNSSIISGALS